MILPLMSLAQLWLVGTSAATSSPLTTTTSLVSSTNPAASSSEGGENVVFQLVGHVKDSMVRMVDGTKEMWGNHGRCNEIRTKQKDYREKLKKQWEFQEQGMTPKEMRERLGKINGGISYDEYVFLIKGKEDRGKLMNMMFLIWGAPKFFPYALMFYPKILPSAFAPLPDASGKETRLETLSRERTNIVIRTLLSMETEAKAIPALAKLNIFGKRGQVLRMDTMDSLAKTVGQIMATPEATLNAGAVVVMNTMEHLIYNLEPFSRAEQRLVNVPKCITSGIMNAINGPSPFAAVMPHILKRVQVLNHIQKVTDVDNFLVGEKVSIDDLSTARLLEACNDRMIGGPGRSDEELRQQLSEWLDLAVVKPTYRIQKTGEFYNENLGRTALMSYYSVNGARDERSASYLPRLMFQGQLSRPSSETDERDHNRKR